MAWTYRLQLIRCGKPGCRCARGSLHGPYWYAFSHAGGKMRSRYVGKTRHGDDYDRRDEAHRRERGPVGGERRKPDEAKERFVWSGKMSNPVALRIMGFGGMPTLQQLKARWRTLVQDHHPDRGGSAQIAAAINAAYSHLKGQLV